MCVTSWAVTAYPSRAPAFTTDCSCCSIFSFLCCIFNCLSFFCWPLYCLSFFDLRILTRTFISLIFSCGHRCKQQFYRSQITFDLNIRQWSICQIIAYLFDLLHIKQMLVVLLHINTFLFVFVSTNSTKLREILIRLINLRYQAASINCNN
jgi:hypothetical protein